MRKKQILFKERHIITCAHSLFKKLQMRCKALSVTPHLGFGNIAKFGKSNSDFRRISDTDERSQGRKLEAGRVVHIMFTIHYYANSLCSKNLIIMLKKFHYYAHNFFPGSLILLPKIKYDRLICLYGGLYRQHIV